MAARVALVALVLCSYPAPSLPYPSYLSCDWSCLRNARPGGSFNRHTISHYEPGSGTNCAVSTDIPAAGYVPGETYSVTVSSAASLGKFCALQHPSLPLLLPTPPRWRGPLARCLPGPQPLAN